jgi:methylated-DNA-[protein]-cysteine S-methyltransferase
MTKPTPHTDWVENNAKPASKLTKTLDALYSPAPAANATQRAQAAVAAALAAESGPTIYYDQLEESPLGPLWVAVGPHGLIAVEYSGSEASFRAYLSKLSKGNLQRSAEKVAAAKKQVSMYLHGERAALDLDVDLSTITPFQRRVLEETRRVPRGRVSTYAEIAKRIGSPKAVRAVGQALRRNPIPIVVPCHRVISSDGSLGGYGGQLRDIRKIELLKLEGVRLF